MITASELLGEVRHRPRMGRCVALMSCMDGFDETLTVEEIAALRADAARMQRLREQAERIAMFEAQRPQWAQIAEVMESRRIAMGLSVTGLGELIGTTYNTIHGYLTVRCPIHCKFYGPIREKLGIDVLAMLG